MSTRTKKIILVIAISLAIIGLAIGLGILAGQLILDNVI